MSEALAVAEMSDEQIKRLKAHCVTLSKSGLLPDHFTKTPEAIYTALEMARVLGEEPVTLMQAIFFIGGKAGFTAQYMLSRMRRRAVIKGTVRYDVSGKGDSLTVRARVVDAMTNDVIEGPPVSFEMAKAEGWTKNPKYKSMPEVMLRKRAITFLVRDHYPDVLMGYLTVDELRDMDYAGRPALVASTAADSLNAAIEAAVDPGTGEVIDADEAGCAADPADTEEAHT